MMIKPLASMQKLGATLAALLGAVVSLDASTAFVFPAHSG